MKLSRRKRKNIKEAGKAKYNPDTGEENPYYGYTVKDYKRDKKTHKQRMRAERKENRKSGTGLHPLNK
jgi:hypothetical protein